MIEKMRKALDAAVEAIGGQPREGQIEMAEAVANALSDRHHLLVQAGTGTGKSLAYLVPALVHGKKVWYRGVVLDVFWQVLVLLHL